MRRAPSLLLSFGLLPGLLVLPTVSAPAPEPEPVAPAVTTLPVDGVDAEALDDIAADPAVPEGIPRAGSAPGAGPDVPDPADPDPDALASLEDVEEFTVVGVTWQADSAPADGVAVQVRVREDGEWSAWEQLPVVDEGPDAGTPEHARAARRAGTGPLLTEGADGVQVRVDSAGGTAPDDLEVSLIDPGESGADEAVHGSLPPASAGAAAPRIITRAQWGADESLVSGTHRVNQTVKSMVVHHTAGSNAYSPAQAVREIRGIYAYHTRTLGWADIGYNLVVDRYGNLYEGRRGSISRAVQGAHAGGFNKDTYGIAVMGNFDAARPPAAVSAALGRAIGWKLGQYGVDPRGRTTLMSAGGGTAKFPAGTVVTVNAVSGHRDVGNTACPGRYLYPLLPTIRSTAASVAAATPTAYPAAHPRDWSGDGAPDVVAANPSGRLWLYPGTGTGSFRAPVLIGRGWGLRDLVTQVGDWDGDGAPDLLGREQATGNLWLYRGDGRGGFRSGRSIGGSWRNIDALLGVGDWNGDGAPDVLARRLDNRSLWLYPGNGAGGWRTPVEVGAGFGGYDLLAAVGDWAGSGGTDVVGRRAADGALVWMRRGNRGRVEVVRTIGTGWSGMTELHGPGDWSLAAGTDLLARTASGQLYMYTSTSGGGLSAGRLVGRGWTPMRVFS